MPSRILAALAALGLAGAAAADTVVLVADRDNTLYQSATGALSNGSGIHMFAGRNGPTGGNITLRGLLHFDVAGAIPTEATIDAVSLTLTVTTPFRGARAGDIDLHRVTSNWGEGASVGSMGEAGGAAAQTDDATWLHTFFATSLWQSPGGDFAETTSASFPVAASGTQTWEGPPELVADVQAWLDQPEQNFGWIFMSVPESGSALRFDTRHAGAANRPMLEIEFTPEPAGTASTLCAGAALLALRRLREARCLG